MNMRPIPPSLREELAADSYMAQCAICGSKQVEFHHAIMFRNRQLNERWAIQPSCYAHHRGPLFNAERWRHIALQRAKDEELNKYPRAGFIQERAYLARKYGDGKV